MGKPRLCLLFRFLGFACAILALPGMSLGACPGTWAVTQRDNILEIAYGSGTDFPQYGALHLNHSYLRLNYGPGSGWGTSVVLLPAFWSGGTYHQGAPVTASWQVEGCDLLLSVAGSIGGLGVSCQVRVSPPSGSAISAQVATQVSGSVILDPRPGEAFKPVVLSSMHISPTMWDARVAYAGCRRLPIPESGWIVQPPSVAQTFGLEGGTSAWKVNAPTMEVSLDRPFQVTGWVTASTDPNDDNVEFWAASDTALSSWTYRVVASAMPTAGASFFHTEGRHLVSDSTGENVSFRGVNLNGLEYGTFFDHPYPGVEGTNYFKPRPEDLDRLKALGCNVIRVPFEWARLVAGWQPAQPLPSSLDAAYLGLLDRVVAMAGERCIYVVLDMHDFLKYWSGQSSQACVSMNPTHQSLLAHTWKLLAQHFRDNPAVLGYDIMNEPVRQEEGEPCGSCDWHVIAQSVVDTIRTVDQTHLIFVEGPNFSLASDWAVENGAQPFITDRVAPPRIVYSPHVFFDYNNDSRYDQPGEETSPLGGWEYYLRDRLLPALDWSFDNDVPVFIGETNVPCTQYWAYILDYAFLNFLDPLHVSVALWHFIDPARCPLETSGCALNLAACPGESQLDVLRRHPGGVYSAGGPVTATPSDSPLYFDQRINPWNAGDGFFDDPGNPGIDVNFCAADPVPPGDCALRIHFNRANYAGVKFIHHHGLGTRRFISLCFSIYLTGSGQQNFKVFTTRPRSDCDPGPDPVYPPSFSEQPELRDFLPNPSVGQWQQVEIPLGAIVDPFNRIINGIAFQNMGQSQDAFYLDGIRLVGGTPMPAPPISINSGAECTGSRLVIVEPPCFCAQVMDGSCCVEVRLKNDQGDWGPWEWCNPWMPWTLSPGGGTRTVYAQCRTSDGVESLVGWDTIYLVIFEDVGCENAKRPYVEALFRAGITTGCSTSPPRYCPSANVTRAQMAVFLCRAAAKGPLDRDTPTFSDVPKSNPYYGYIERLADAASWGGTPPTSGCRSDNPATPENEAMFCPWQAVTREQIAKFLCIATGRPPMPSCSGTFADVPPTSPSCGFVERLADPASWPGGVAVTGGCAANPRRYCPYTALTRGEMAVFLVRAFGLEM